MPRRLVSARDGEKPLFDVVSYGRKAPQEDGRYFTAAEVEHIRRTLQRAPEVMVKVLSRGSNDLKAVAKHADYIRRNGMLELETDDGGQGLSGKALVTGWNLDLDEVRSHADLSGGSRLHKPKLVHKLMFSMPAGTPPDKVLLAVRKFAREEFWGQHRYAFTLHTDEDHPHVHLMLKAVSERGVRLNIRKATLRQWRSEFARQLRSLGVAANATERAVRGQNRKALKDPIYRASLRGESSFVREKAVRAASSTLNRPNPTENESRQRRTRLKVQRGWRAISERLRGDGHLDLAAASLRFLERMPTPRTDEERLMDELRLRVRDEERTNGKSR